MQVLKMRRWWTQLFIDSLQMPWEEAVKRHEERVLEALCGPWGRL